MKMYSEMLQNLPYIWNMKTHIVFFVFHFVLLNFPLINDVIFRGKWQNENKYLLVFLYSKSMENFEAFSSGINFLYVKSDYNRIHNMRFLCKNDNWWMFKKLVFNRTEVWKRLGTTYLNFATKFDWFKFFKKSCLKSRGAFLLAFVLCMTVIFLSVSTRSYVFEWYR